MKNEEHKPYDLRRRNGKIVNLLDNDDMNEIRKAHNFKGRGICLDCQFRVQHPMGNGTWSQCRHPKLYYAYKDPMTELEYHKSPAKIRWAIRDVGVKVDNVSRQVNEEYFIFPFRFNHYKVVECKGFKE